MDTMQKELQTAYPTLRIQFLGVNENGQESGNASATSGRVIPWLQDVDANSNGRSDVWYDIWNVTFRDVVILDGTNTKVGVYNVTVNNLATPENYAALKKMVVDAAMASQKPWQNPVEALDVDNGQSVTALDALIIINRLNLTGPEKLLPPTGTQVPPPYYDCNGDNEVAPVDALNIINSLNADSAAGAGEGEEDASALGPAAEARGVTAGASSWLAYRETQSVPPSVPAATTPVREELARPSAEIPWDNQVDLVFASAVNAGDHPTDPLTLARPSPERTIDDLPSAWLLDRLLLTRPESWLAS